MFCVPARVNSCAGPCWPRVDGVSQLSFFSAESVPPAVADLTGILAAPGQVVLKRTATVEKDTLPPPVLTPGARGGSPRTKPAAPMASLPPPVRPGGSGSKTPSSESIRSERSKSPAPLDDDGALQAAAAVGRSWW